MREWEEIEKAAETLRGLQRFALAIVSLDRTDDIDAVIAATPDDVLRLIDPDMLL